MVTHHKEAIFRHLIREAEVTFSQSQLIDIRFLQHLAIHRHKAVAVNRNHIPGDTDDSLEQQLVLPVEAAQISLFQSICFQQNQNVLILQGWVHAVTRHLQHRQQVRCQQHRNGCHNDQRIGGAFQHTLVTPAVRQAFALLHDLLHRGNLNAFSAQSLHFQYAPSLFAVGENSVPCTGYCALTDSKY